MKTRRQPDVSQPRYTLSFVIASRICEVTAPGQVWATRLRPRCSTGNRKSGKRSLMKGGVQTDRCWHHTKEGQCSHLTLPQFCPTNRSTSPTLSN